MSEVASSIPEDTGGIRNGRKQEFPDQFDRMTFKKAKMSPVILSQRLIVPLALSFGVALAGALQAERQELIGARADEMFMGHLRAMYPTFNRESIDGFGVQSEGHLHDPILHYPRVYPLFYE